ncbi:hypothetical protein BHE74_00054798 [Ensete ventricosum]|nr:hypothetical protein BHE74_00054798 [Ensete ventricosum]
MHASGQTWHSTLHVVPLFQRDVPPLVASQWDAPLQYPLIPSQWEHSHWERDLQQPLVSSQWESSQRERDAPLQQPLVPSQQR